MFGNVLRVASLVLGGAAFFFLGSSDEIVEEEISVEEAEFRGRVIYYYLSG